jgi:hypothetical protein
MASTPDYVEYVAERLASTGRVRYKKMFGEYMVYVNDKPLVLVCDNTAFVKFLPCLDSLMANAERGLPYDGAKEHYILDVEDSELAEHVIEELNRVVNVPKSKDKKSAHPNVLYHFTSLYHLNKILSEKWLTTTESNLTFSQSANPHVVWMTDMPIPDKHGLLFQDNMPDELNKTFYRISIRWKKHFWRWDKWSEEKGIDTETKRVLIESARAQDTYKSWYVSEKNIPINDWLTIEDTRTGKVLFKWEDKRFTKQY